MTNVYSNQMIIDSEKIKRIKKSIIKSKKQSKNKNTVGEQGKFHFIMLQKIKLVTFGWYIKSKFYFTFKNFLKCNCLENLVPFKRCLF